MNALRLRALAVATAALGLAAACGTTVPNAGSVADGQGLGPAAAPTGGSTGTGQSPAGTTGGGALGGTTGGGSSSSSSGRAPSTSTGSIATAGSGGSAATVGGIPASGPGWDAKSVNLGIIVATDASNTLHTLGISIDPGDELGDARAVVAHLNEQGGLFGRKVNLLVKDDQASRVLANPAGAGAEDCTYFTQDHHAIAVINTDASLDLDAFRACFAKAHTPLVSETNSAFDDVVTSKLAPYFYNALSVPTNLVVQPLFDHLKAQGYFTGWNAQAGAPSPAGKVKVGVIYSSAGSGPRAAKSFLGILQRAGYPTDSFEMNSASDANAAVLHFAGNGVTHLIDPTGCCFLLYLPQANSQHYYPRLGITTAMGPQVVEGIASTAQLKGALGIGWFPTLDVDASKDPGPNPGTRECLAALKAGGQTFSGKRFAEAFGMALCDGLRLAYLGAKAGGGLSPQAIRAGVLKIGTSFPTGGPFSSGLSQTDFGVPGSGRDLGYDSACSCFTYRGSSFRF